MFHLYVDRPADALLAGVRRVAAQRKVWTWSWTFPSDTPGWSVVKLLGGRRDAGLHPQRGPRPRRRRPPRPLTHLPRPAESIVFPRRELGAAGRRGSTGARFPSAPGRDRPGRDDRPTGLDHLRPHRRRAPGRRGARGTSRPGHRPPGRGGWPSWLTGRPHGARDLRQRRGPLRPAHRDRRVDRAARGGRRPGGRAPDPRGECRGSPSRSRRRPGSPTSRRTSRATTPGSSAPSPRSRSCTPSPWSSCSPGTRR